ncbi:MAG: glycosyltransferase [Verrucomicrobiota bacterium]|nr:glycosyltransferase [Verrucomicrobiota bacterium]
MKITILSHNLTSNAVMRAHRLALAARQFAEVSLLGPVKHRGAWGVLPQEPWIHPVDSKKFPKFFENVLELIAAGDGDLLIAVKPYLASYGVALLAAACRKVPVILDLDDLDLALAREPERSLPEQLEDLRDPASLAYLRVLGQATGAASAITVASSLLQARFGGTLVPHGCPVEQFAPETINREQARTRFGFAGPVVLFPGTRRTHKGLKPLAKAVAKIPGARLAVLCRPDDYAQPEWDSYPLLKLPLVPYASLPSLLAATDVIAIPQLDTEGARHQMPMKVYDAMAMARPIVASAVSDLPAVLDGCGRLVPPGDVAGLAAALRDLLEHPAEARALGERARARCLEKYSMQSVAAALRQAVDQALRAPRSVAAQPAAADPHWIRR